MSVAGTIDAPLDMFGGLVTDMAPADLPPGVSPDCADVKFIQGGVQTRPGLLVPPGLGGIAGNPAINYLKTFVDLNGNARLLYLDSLGVLWQDFPQGTETLIQSALAASCYGKSATLFGREYLAISDGKLGNDLPRQWDTTNFDRVSQVGPGAGPAVADAAAESALTIAASPNGANRANNTVTITTTTAHGYLVGQSVLIAGVTDVSFNGTFAILTVPTSTTFTYGQVGAASNSGGGTATLQPLVSAGQHQVVVIFKTRQGYLAKPSPPVIYTAAGGRRANVTGIPTGPANVMARIVAFTSSGGASFFYTAAMVIPDNTTTSLVVDFLDTTLLASTSVDYLFRLVELGECLGFIDYSNRLFAWGERNHANNWLNLTFDGGWSGNFPLGWTADGTSGPGGSRDSVNVVWGDAYRITGDGATATRGLITQPTAKDFFGAALIAPNTSYNMRARVMKGGGLAQGTLHVHLFSASGGINTTGLQVTAAQAGASYAEFIAQLAPAQATIPSDLVLRVYADGTPTNNGFFVIDNIEIYPAAIPANVSLVRGSRVNDPESFDGVNGFLQVAVNNGQAVRACFQLRERLYFVKEHSLYVTQDDGLNEPASWAISEVSRKVGTPSVNGVDVGEEWAVIVNREGVYIYWGPEPVKISQEIQPLWDTINWQYGHTIWVRIDTQNKRILIGVPIGAAASPNRVLMMDYRGLGSAEQIATNASIHYSTFSGKILAVGNARKWCPWFITANSAALVERADGTAQMFLGNGAATGKIYQLSDAQFSDDGAAISSYYTTYFFPHHELEQALQLGSHRKLFYYLAQFVEGAGSLSVTALPPGGMKPIALPTLALSNPGSKDLELPVNVPAERVAFKVGTNAAGAWFKLQKFIASLRADPWAPVRGLN